MESNRLTPVNDNLLQVSKECYIYRNPQGKAQILSACNFTTVMLWRTSIEYQLLGFMPSPPGCEQELAYVVNEKNMYGGGTPIIYLMNGFDLEGRTLRPVWNEGDLSKIHNFCDYPVSAQLSTLGFQKMENKVDGEEVYLKYSENPSGSPRVFLVFCNGSKSKDISKILTSVYRSDPIEGNPIDGEVISVNTPNGPGSSDVLFTIQNRSSQTFQVSFEWRQDDWHDRFTCWSSKNS